MIDDQPSHPTRPPQILRAPIITKYQLGIAGSKIIQESFGSGIFSANAQSRKHFLHRLSVLLHAAYGISTSIDNYA